MKSRLKYAVTTLVCAIGILAISLGGVSSAATAPTVTILNPVSKGLRTPVRVAVDDAGTIYVADQRSGGIKIINKFGRLVKSLATDGNPQGVALAADGSLIVAHESTVAVYSVSGGPQIKKFVDSAGAPFVFKSARGIAVDDSGFCYISDNRAGLVYQFTATGVFTGKSIGSGVLKAPNGIAFEKQSRLIAVADSMKNCVVFFDLNGNAVKAIGADLVNPAAIPTVKFSAPSGVAFEYAPGSAVPLVTRMYVVDTFQGHVQVVDPAGTGTSLVIPGTTTNYIGKYGTDNGSLMIPSDVQFDAVSKRLVVVNGIGNLTMYGIDGGSSPTDAIPPTLTINPVAQTVTTPTITIDGTVEAGASVAAIAGSSTQIGTVRMTSSTTWSVQVSSLAAGPNTIQVSAIDPAGNVTSLSAQVSYQLPAPALAVAPVQAVTNILSQVVSGTVDAGASVTVTNAATGESGAATVSGTGWTYNARLVEGANALTIQASRQYSASTSLSAAVTVDSIAPAMTVSALADGSYTSTQVQNVAGLVSDATAVSLTVNGAPVALAADGSFSTSVTLLQGANALIIQAADLAGNLTSLSRTITFDATKPVITVAAPVDNATTANTILAISGTVSEAAQVMVNGAPAPLDPTTLSWNASVALLDGLNTVDIVAIDLAGNTSSLKRTVTLDTSKPLVAITSPAQDLATNALSMAIQATASDNLSGVSQVTATVNSVPLALVLSGTAYSGTIDFAAEGSYAVTVTAVDAAGNSAATVRTITVDRTAPALTLDPVVTPVPVRLSGTVEPAATVTVRNGTVAVGTVTATAGVWSADLTGITYNPVLLAVEAVDAAGNLTRVQVAVPVPPQPPAVGHDDDDRDDHDKKDDDKKKDDNNKKKKNNDDDKKRKDR